MVLPLYLCPLVIVLPLLLLLLVLIGCQNADILLCAGADLHATDSSGRSALQIAAARGHDDLVVYLV